MLCTNLAFVILMDKWVKREGRRATVYTFKTLHALTDVIRTILPQQPVGVCLFPATICLYMLASQVEM